MIDELDCGILEIEHCKKCGSEYFSDEAMRVVEQKLKQEGLWGQRKEVTLWKSGNSVVLRIPVKIASILGLKANTKASIYPETREKLVIEI